VRGLPRNQVRALRLLAVAQTADFSLTAAAAMLGLAPDEAESLLESLVDLHLMETADERYSFHNPVREFARARALIEEGAAACRAALVRLTRFYAATLSNALLTTGPGAGLGSASSAGLEFDGAAAARAWIRDEQENMRAISSQAAEIGDAPAELLTRLMAQSGLGRSRPPSSVVAIPAR
jgi:hypothetical protein